MKKLFFSCIIMFLCCFFISSCTDKGREDLLPQKYIDGLKIELKNYSNRIKENPNDPVYKDLWDYFLAHNNQYPDFEKKYSAKL